MGRSIVQIRDGMTMRSSCLSKIRFPFEIWTVQSFDLMQGSPEARELYDCGFEFARVAMEWGYREFESTLEPHLEETGGVSAGGVARLLSSAVRGLKLVSQDATELGTLIDDLLKLVLDNEP